MISISDYGFESRHLKNKAGLGAHTVFPPKPATLLTRAGWKEYEREAGSCGEKARDGRWKMECGGQAELVSGQWSVVSGQWSVVSGQ